MKQILYILALFSALFFSLLDGNTAYGQNMASEVYNPNSPWNQAGKTGEYHMKKCLYCDKWITGYDEHELDEAMNTHIKEKHPMFDPDSDDNSETSDVGTGSSGGTSSGSSGGTSSGSSDGLYSNEASLVNINKVAYAMQKIGICNYWNFIYECQWYGISGNDEDVNASNIVGYIIWKYNARSNIDLRTAINRNYNFIVFARPSSGKYYNVCTNYDIKDISSLVCDYYIVF